MTTKHTAGQPDYSEAIKTMRDIQRREWPECFSGHNMTERKDGKLSITNTVSAWSCFIRNRRVIRLPDMSVLSDEYFEPAGVYGVGGGILQ